jgi:hypothetical protein
MRRSCDNHPAFFFDYSTAIAQIRRPGRASRGLRYGVDARVAGVPGVGFGRLQLPRLAAGTCGCLAWLGVPRICCGVDAFGGRCPPGPAVWAVVGAELGGRPARMAARAVLAPRLSGVVPAAGQAWPAARLYLRRGLHA